MYTDEDLNLAIEKNVLSADSVDAFRSMMSSSNNSSMVDEENFRLVGGFNDIFIVIACALLLFSSLFVTVFFFFVTAVHSSASMVRFRLRTSELLRTLSLMSCFRLKVRVHRNLAWALIQNKY